MSRSTFFTRTSQSQNLGLEQDRKRDQSPLLPLHEHRNSVSLRDLSPRSSHSYTHEQQTNTSSRRASPSPSPSFYRDALSSKASSGLKGYVDEEGQRERERESYPQQPPSLSLSPSPSRTKESSNSGSRRRIMFDAPPPPIAASVMLSPPSQGTQRGTSRESGRGNITKRSLGVASVDPLVVLERRERAIQRDLQLLLDAQSAGLIHGFGGGGGEEASDAGSNTPTTRSVNGSSARRGSGSGNRGIMPVRQPKSKPIGLRGARRGLLREMGELVEVKDEEATVLNNEISRREILLRKIGTWEERISGVKGKLETANGEVEESREIKELKSEEKAVDAEIREMEDRLAAMKARKRWLGERIKEGVNKREAKLSSYRGALKEAEAEVKEFLRRPPIATSVIMGEEEGFSALPPSRRTLGMARDWWAKEIHALKERKGEVETEREALEEGARLWGESVKAVVGFEDELRVQMGSRDGDLRGQIGKMRSVIEALENVRDGAEERGWNLLVCAVGAEVEAFKQGRGILMGALGMVDEEERKGEEEGTENGLDELDGGKLDRQASSETAESEDDGRNLAELERQVRLEREESEESDGPNLAELLVDRGGDDTS